MKKLILLAILPLLCIEAKPLKVDEILTKNGTFKLNMGIGYANIQRKKGVISPSMYQTQNGDFISVPTYFGDSQTNQDYLNYSFTLRYGVTQNLELFSTVNFYSSESHFTFNDILSHQSSKGFNALNTGAIYQVKSEDDTPSFIVGISASAVEKTVFSKGTDTNHFKRVRIFATSYYTVDPVVFLVQVSYGKNFKKEFKEDSIENGDIFSFSPQIYFAVNPYTNLYGGVRYTHQGKNKMNDKSISNNTSNLSFLSGMSYEINAKIILDINTEFLNTAQMSQNNITSTLSYKF